MKNILELTSNNYWDEVGKSALEKEDRTLLREIIASFISGENISPITKKAYQNFSKKLPKILLDGRPIELLFTQLNNPGVYLHFSDGENAYYRFEKTGGNFDFLRKRKSPLTSSSFTRRRSIRKAFSR